MFLALAQWNQQGWGRGCFLSPYLVVPASPGKITRLFDVGSWNSSQLIKTAECLNTWKVRGTSLPAHAGVRQTEALRGAGGWGRQTYGSIFSWTNAPDSPASESLNLRTNCGNNHTPTPAEDRGVRPSETSLAPIAICHSPAANTPTLPLPGSLPQIYTGSLD